MKRDTNALRNELCDFIRVIDEKRLNALYDLLENDIDATKDRWQDVRFVQEMEARYEAMEKGEDMGVSVDDLKAAITENKRKKYGT